MSANLPVSAAPAVSSGAKAKSKPVLLIALGGLVVAAIIALLPPPAGLSREAMIYMGIFVALIIYMVTEVFPSFVTMFLTLAALIIFKVAPAKDVLAAFGNTTVWFVVAVLGFAAAIGASGLLKRVAFSLMRLFPETYTGQVSGLALVGILLGAAIPSGQAKVSILMPLASTMSSIFGYEKGSKGASGLFSTIFVYCVTFGTTFLTGSLGPALILPFLGKEASPNFLTWLQGTWLWGVVLAVLSFIFIVTYYRPKGSQAKSSAGSSVKGQIGKLGPMTSNEKFAAVVLVASILLWVTESVHGISTLVVTLVAFSLLTIKGLFKNQDFGTKIAWSIIVTMGTIIGLSTLLSTLKIGDWIASTLSPFVGPFATNPYLMVIAICVLTYLLRYVIVSQMAVLTIMFALFGSFAQAAGINMFVVVFTGYMATSVWNLQFHNAGYLTAEAAAGGLIEHKNVVSMSYAFMVINLIACLASVPLWRAIGYIP